MSYIEEKDTANATNATDEENQIDPDAESLGFIFVPLAVLITVMFLSAMVYLMARNRRKITNIYKRVHVPSFSFDDASDSEEEEDPTECLLNGKLQFDNRYDSYQIQTYNEKRELYT